MIDKNDNFIVWDLTKPIFFLPEEIKKIYAKNYRFYYKKYNLWINKISEDNSSNINWWFSRPASRDERLSNLYKNICIIKSLKDLDKLKIRIKIISNSSELKRFTKNYKIKNIEIITKKNNIILRIFIFFKEIIILKLSIILSKIFSKYDFLKKNENNLIDYFDFKKRGSVNKLFGNAVKNTSHKLLFVPTFVSFSFRNYFKYRNKKNLLIKEYFLSFFDLIFIIKNLFLKNIIIKHKFIYNDYRKIILEEFDIDNNFRSIITAYVNYLFFKRLKLKGINFKNIISWHENQLVDKGWSFGIKKYFPKTNYIGYQGSTLHPHFFNLSQTQEEVNAGCAPKNIILIGKKYKKNRSIFFKKINLKYTNFHRFSFEKNYSNKKYILFLLSGIKEIDKLLISIFKYVKGLGYKNLKIKFHPILTSNNLNEKFKEEIKGNGSKIINLSKIVITTSYTSGLYESLARNSFTIMVNTNPLDQILFQDLKKYSKRVLFLEKISTLEKSLNKILKKKMKFSDNKKIKYNFFNK